MVSKTIVLGILCAVLSMALWLSSPQRNCFGTLFPSIQDVERQARLQLPVSTTNMAYEFSNGIIHTQCALWLRFEMNPDDLTAFQASTLITAFDNMTTVPPLAMEHCFANLDYTEEQYLSGTGRDSYFDQTIVVDVENASKLIVYVFVMELES
ncbi:MAG: hypothetical protein AAF126_20320 [Chloroflexota bacterium]